MIPEADYPKIHLEARQRFMDFQKNPPATNEMYDYQHFLVEVAFENGFKSKPITTDYKLINELLSKYTKISKWIIENPIEDERISRYKEELDLYKRSIEALTNIGVKNV